MYSDHEIFKTNEFDFQQISAEMESANVGWLAIGGPENDLLIFRNWNTLELYRRHVSDKSSQLCKAFLSSNTHELHIAHTGHLYFKDCATSQNPGGRLRWKVLDHETADSIVEMLADIDKQLDSASTVFEVTLSTRKPACVDLESYTECDDE